MKRIVFIGQASVMVVRLPHLVYTEIRTYLRAILSWSDDNAADEHAPGTLRIDPEARLRAFSVRGYLVTYTPPLRRGGRLHVFRIARKR